MANQALWSVTEEIISPEGMNYTMINMYETEGMITFTYYNDIDKATKFYREVMGFKLVMDRDWVKIFKVGKDSHIGLVNKERGHHKPSEDKPVMLSVMVKDIDKWYDKLNSKGVKTNHPPQEGGDIHMMGFLTWDPEGYVIEILEFLTKPYGE